MASDDLGGVDMDGRVFQVIAKTGAEADADTEFRFRQAADMVWGRYSGGSIRMGFLVGTSNGGVLDFRYTQLRADGATATGHCVDRIEALGDGRLRLHETWWCDSTAGHGTTLLEERRRA